MNKQMEFIENICNCDFAYDLIIGAGNRDIPNKNIYDRSRFSGVFDFGITNEEQYIDEEFVELQAVTMDISDYKTISPRFNSNIIERENNMYLFKSEKCKKMVVDWSTMKFMDINFLYIFGLCYMGKQGIMYFDASIPHNYSVQLNDKRITQNGNNLLINELVFGKTYFTTGLFVMEPQYMKLSFDDIVQNNFIYLSEKFGDNFIVEYVNDNNYPNCPNDDKKIMCYFKITKKGKTILDKQQFKKLMFI